MTKKKQVCVVNVFNFYLVVDLVVSQGLTISEHINYLAIGRKDTTQFTFKVNCVVDYIQAMCYN